MFEAGFWVMVTFRCPCQMRSHAAFSHSVTQLWAAYMGISVGICTLSMSSPGGLYLLTAGFVGDTAVIVPQTSNSLCNFLKCEYGYKSEVHQYLHDAKAQRFAEMSRIKMFPGPHRICQGPAAA